MPTYLYKRRDNEKLVEEFFHMPSDRKDTITCEDGVKADFSIADTWKGSAQRVALENRCWPMESKAAGVNPQQVTADGRYKDPKARKRHPRHKFNPETGDMVFDSQKQRRKQLDDIGMQDLNAYYG